MNTPTSLKLNRKKIRLIAQFALETMAESFAPGAGVFVKICFLLWDFFNNEELNQ
jgi:hypothetical protein